MSDDITKVYLFFLKDEKELYAYTIVKEYRDIFRNQRNMKLFKESSLKMDKYELSVFENKNYKKKIYQDFLYDGKTDIVIYATTEESNSLSESCMYITNIMNSVKDEVAKYCIKEKYLKSILKLTEKIILKDNDKDKGIINVNTFKLFYHLFRNTFSEYSDIEIQ